MCEHDGDILGGSSVAVPPDPAGTLAEEPPAGGGAPPPSQPSQNTTNAKNSSPEHQPADSWEEAAVDGDPLLTPENEEVNFEKNKKNKKKRESLVRSCR